VRRKQAKPFTLETVFQSPREFGIAPLPSLEWLPDGRHWLREDAIPGGRALTLWKEEAETGERHPLFLPSEIQPAEIWQQVVFSHRKVYDEGRKILFFERGRTSRPTRSHGNIYLLNTETKRIHKITHSTKEQYNAKMSPDGKWVAYVRDNDLYAYNLQEEREHRITFDGSEAVYNGRFGWVYEEEWGITDGFLFSPDGTLIAYWQVDETEVPLISIQEYRSINMSAFTMRYPKAGEKNPNVRVGVVPVTGGETLWLNLKEAEDDYLVNLQWREDGKLLIQRIPRLQNRIDLLLADPVTGTVKILLQEESPYWVDRQGDVKLLPDGRFLWLSDRDGFQHLYLYEANGNLLRQLTKGEWDVTNLVGLDKEHELVYFLAASPEPTERHLFYTSLQGDPPVRLTEEPGVHSVLMNPQATLYLENWSNHQTPPQSRLCRSSGKVVRNLVTNTKEGLNAYRYRDWEYGTLTTTEGHKLYYKILFPYDFDPQKKYPVYMTNYGGPGSQVVLNSWDLSLFERFLTEQGFIVFAVDNRGTGARGRAWKKTTYLRLGECESLDQAEAARWLSRQPFVDKDRIAIYGWSYGGYMALSCILRHPRVWKSAIAGAPVTDWRFYDTIYTERYMRTPQQNEDGYRTSSCLTYAHQLEGHLLLIHGTSDDNVHLQNTLRLAEELQRANKQFEMMLYPHQRHGVSLRRHLYQTLFEFLRRTLLPQNINPPPNSPPGPPGR
jgi:dipeptidyl-peptidase-4